MDEAKRRRRAFIRTHHPDVGGDPAEFVAGLAALDPDRVARAVTSDEDHPGAHTVADAQWPLSLVTVVLRRLRRSRNPRLR